MSGPQPLPPQRPIPTLTEVVHLPLSTGPQGAAPLPPRADAGHAGQRPAFNEEEMVRRILCDVQRQVDLMVENQLREAFVPIISRLSDALIRETAGQLAAVLREMVARAVAAEVSRHREP
ncbi:MAG TPA: hypothetical protein VFP68_14725 [Burkholderiaceae bacterium]|nr:hypothetical protein [Burkholderiaceae bacterium]